MQLEITIELQNTDPNLENCNSWAGILELCNKFTEAFKSSIFLLIKYTILEQMSRKISQINFSFIQHLYVGDDLYITDYEQISSVCHGFGFSRGRRENWSWVRRGWMYCSHAWTTTFTCILYIHGSFTNTPRECSWFVFHKKPQIFKTPSFYIDIYTTKEKKHIPLWQHLKYRKWKHHVFGK